MLYFSVSKVNRVLYTGLIIVYVYVCVCVCANHQFTHTAALLYAAIILSQYSYTI